MIALTSVLPVYHQTSVQNAKPDTIWTAVPVQSANLTAKIVSVIQFVYLAPTAFTWMALPALYAQIKSQTVSLA